MTLNHNYECSNGAVTGIAGNDEITSPFLSKSTAYFGIKFNFGSSNIVKKHQSCKSILFFR